MTADVTTRCTGCAQPFFFDSPNAPTDTSAIAFLHVLAPVTIDRSGTPATHTMHTMHRAVATGIYCFACAARMTPKGEP